MADINVVRKGGSRAWLWWLVAAIIALLIVMALLRRDQDGAYQQPVSSAPAVSVVSADAA